MNLVCTNADIDWSTANIQIFDQFYLKIVRQIEAVICVMKQEVRISRKIMEKKRQRKTSH